jgi:hypothetical protein
MPVWNPETVRLTGTVDAVDLPSAPLGPGMLRSLVFDQAEVSTLTLPLDVGNGRRGSPRNGHCRDRADEGEPDVLLEAGQIEPGDADGDREGGPAHQMETR